MVGGSIAHKFIAFFIAIWTARYLGPENYGLINYASAYTTLFFSLSTLGISSILVNELIKNHDEEGTIMERLL